MPKPSLKIVIASTRPGRVGLPVGEWFEGVRGPMAPSRSS